MDNIIGLYPQYQVNKDRRQHNIPVAVERRSGRDRRSEDRVSLDTQLTRDLYAVKSHVAKLESIAPSMFAGRVNSQTPTFASKNAMTQDQLYKASKPDISEIQRQEAKLQEKASTAFKAGILTAALAGALVVSFMGPTGAVIAVCSAVYIGGRILKELIVRETKETSDKKSKK